MAAEQDSTRLQSSSLADALGELAIACRVLEKKGHASRTLGHVAMRDPDGRGVWLKRSDLGLGEVRNPGDFCLIDMDGALVAGVHPHREWPLYTEVFRRRPDLNFAAHTHAFYSRVFSAVDVPLKQVSSALSYFAEPPARFTLTSDLVNTPELGRAFADALGDHSIVFLRNHGLYFAASTLPAMVVYGISVEDAVREQFLISASGLPWSEPSAAERIGKAKTMGGRRIMSVFWDHLKRDLEASEHR